MENQWEKESKEGIRLSHVFLIVLVVHLVVIGGAFAFQYWRGGAETSVSEVSEKQQKSRSRKKMEVSEPKVQKMAEEISQTTPAMASAEKDTVKPTTTPTLPPPVATPKATVQEVKKEIVVAAPLLHAVVKGDTLSKIAKQYKITLANLLKWNQLADDKIRLGQVLKVSESKMIVAQQEPVAATAARPPVVDTTPVIKPVVETKPATKRMENYTVVKGDTLYRIAKKFGTKPQLILEANQIQDANKIGVGMQLKIPVETEVSKATSPQKIEASHVAMSVQ
ncbi:MAG: LysM peptidoglycan-binding domain-containing protein [Verrucomicrobiae bacterium]|nr:LysM peptidoglycan-binding domain-containing protein [Verrucomicrobiae bacterium]